MLTPTCFMLLVLVASVRAAMEGFIVGGEFAKIENHAYSVFLNIHCVTDDGKGQSWTCGASVLNQKILLTAGHCLYGCNYESHIRVNLGNAHKNKGQIYSTYSFVIHENYDPKTCSNDICLIKVERPLQLGKTAKRVALFKKPPYNEDAKVAGWGLVDEVRGTQTHRLKYIRQKVLSHSVCLRFFRYLPKGTICASSDRPSDFASQGDSGSALVVRGYIQIGLVSYKVPAISNNVVVYTDIGYFYDWIKSYAKEINCVE